MCVCARAGVVGRLLMKVSCRSELAAVTGHAWPPQSSCLGEQLIALEERQPGSHLMSLHLPFTERALCHAV